MQHLEFIEKRIPICDYSEKSFIEDINLISDVAKSNIAKIRKDRFTLQIPNKPDCIELFKCRLDLINTLEEYSMNLRRVYIKLVKGYRYMPRIILEFDKEITAFDLKILDIITDVQRNYTPEITHNDIIHACCDDAIDILNDLISIYKDVIEELELQKTKKDQE